MQTEFQILKPNEASKLSELISVFEIVFEMKSSKRPGPAYLQHLLSKEGFLAVVAMIGGKVIAGLTVYVLDQYYSEKPLAYLYDLAVLPEYQRLGVGTKLVAFTNEYCSGKGFKEMFVQAEKGDLHALEFYRSTKPAREEQVVHFSYTL